MFERLRPRILIAAIAIGAFAIFVAWFLWNRAASNRTTSSSGRVDGTPPAMQPSATAPGTSPITPASTNRSQVEAALWQNLLQTPIDFSGKVVDLERRPMAGALVKYSIAAKLGEQNATMELRSDATGSFRISGVPGVRAQCRSFETWLLFVEGIARNFWLRGRYKY